jgi:hypothetical protein
LDGVRLSNAPAARGNFHQAVLDSRAAEHALSPEYPYDQTSNQPAQVGDFHQAVLDSRAAEQAVTHADPVPSPLPESVRKPDYTPQSAPESVEQQHAQKAKRIAELEGGKMEKQLIDEIIALLKEKVGYERCCEPIYDNTKQVTYKCRYIKGHHHEHETLEQRETYMRSPIFRDWDGKALGVLQKLQELHPQEHP